MPDEIQDVVTDVEVAENDGGCSPLLAERDLHDPALVDGELAATMVQAGGDAPADEPGRMGRSQLLSISTYWFATNFHWAALLMILIPSQIARIDPARKAEWLGLILGIGSLVALVAPPVVGYFSDRCTSRWGRRRPFIAVGPVINIAGLLVLWNAGRMSNLWLFLAGYMIVQLGNNIASGAYTGVIPDMVPPPQVGEASGYMGSMTQGGTLLGVFISGYLLGGAPTPSYALIIVILIVFVCITLKGIQEKRCPEPPSAERWMTVVKSFWINPREHPDFAWVWLTRALVTMGMYMVQPYLQYYLQDMLGVAEPERMAGLLLAAILSGATITGVLGGIIADRIGPKRVVYVANTAIAIISVAFPFSHSLKATFVIGVLYGLGYGAYYGVDWALGCAVLPDKENAAKDMGIWHIAMVLPQSIAPALAGLMLQHFTRAGMIGHYGPGGYQAIFFTAAFFLLLGALLLRNVRGVR